LDVDQNAEECTSQLVRWGIPLLDFVSGSPVEQQNGSFRTKNNIKILKIESNLT
jgi:hypothetical protein